MLGFSGFVTAYNSLLHVDASLLELRMLKVDPNYFGNSVGTTLLDYSRQLAAGREKTLILRPDRPGQLVIAEYRDKEYPMTTEQLREMYRRHGFRDFTPEEVDFYARLVDDAELTSRLWFEGLDPQSQKFTGERRYSMSREEAATLSHIPFDTKIELVRQMYRVKGWVIDNIKADRYRHRKWIQDHLVAQKLNR